MSDIGKVVKVEHDKARYLIVEGSLADGFFGAQKIKRRGKGLHTEVNGQEVWLDEMYRTLSAREVISVKPYKTPRVRQAKAVTPASTPAGPRGRLSGLAERVFA